MLGFVKWAHLYGTVSFIVAYRLALGLVSFMGSALPSQVQLA